MTNNLLTTSPQNINLVQLGRQPEYTGKCKQNTVIIIHQSDQL